MTERLDVQYSSACDAIRAWFYPGSGPGRRPAIVFCPGFTGTKFAAFYQPYVTAFVAAGWSVLLADYRGWGESGGPRGEIVPHRQVQDIRAGLTYLASREDVDPQGLSLFGVSFGGGNAVAVAGLDSRVRSCIAVSPVSDGGLWLHEMRREYEWRQFLAELDENDAEMVAGGIGRSLPPATASYSHAGETRDEHQGRRPGRRWSPSKLRLVRPGDHRLPPRRPDRAHGGGRARLRRLEGRDGPCGARTRDLRGLAARATPRDDRRRVALRDLHRPLRRDQRALADLARRPRHASYADRRMTRSRTDDQAERKAT